MTEEARHQESAEHQEKARKSYLKTQGVAALAYVVNGANQLIFIWNVLPKDIPELIIPA